MPRLRSRVRDSSPAPEFMGESASAFPLSVSSLRFTERAPVKRRGGRVVMQRPAKPWTPVRFRPPPPTSSDQSIAHTTSRVGNAFPTRCQRAAKARAQQVAHPTKQSGPASTNQAIQASPTAHTPAAWVTRYPRAASSQRARLNLAPQAGDAPTPPPHRPTFPPAQTPAHCLGKSPRSCPTTSARTPPPDWRKTWMP